MFLANCLVFWESFLSLFFFCCFFKRQDGHGFAVFWPLDNNNNAYKIIIYYCGILMLFKRKEKHVLTRTKGQGQCPATWKHWIHPPTYTQDKVFWKSYLVNNWLKESETMLGHRLVELSWNNVWFKIKFVSIYIIFELIVNCLTNIVLNLI